MRHRKRIERIAFPFENRKPSVGDGCKFLGARRALN
jgi:hypothetical protein